MIVVTPRCLSATKSASTGYGPSSTSSEAVSVRSARHGCTKMLAGCSSTHTPSAPRNAQDASAMATIRRLGLYMVFPLDPLLYGPQAYARDGWPLTAVGPGLPARSADYRPLCLRQRCGSIRHRGVGKTM